MPAAEIGDLAAPPAPVRRFFSDEEELAIAGETELPGAKVSAVARKYGIVTRLLFRWRAQFGIAPKKRSKLARVVLPDDMPATRALRDLVRPPERMKRPRLLDEPR
ncbi:transposase-like protein [Bradyrhizobium sp. USDA 4369]